MYFVELSRIFKENHDKSGRTFRQSWRKPVGVYTTVASYEAATRPAFYDTS